jgi:transcriptional antiterminator Rof (Rho-off)
MRQRGLGVTQPGSTDGQVGRSMEMAGEVRTEGVLLGKRVEAYARGHEERERQLALAKETAQETAEVCLDQITHAQRQLAPVCAIISIPLTNTHFEDRTGCT